MRSLGLSLGVMVLIATRSHTPTTPLPKKFPGSMPPAQPPPGPPAGGSGTIDKVRDIAGSVAGTTKTVFDGIGDILKRAKDAPPAPAPAPQPTPQGGGLDFDKIDKGIDGLGGGLGGSGSGGTGTGGSGAGSDDSYYDPDRQG